MNLKGEGGPWTGLHPPDWTPWTRPHCPPSPQDNLCAPPLFTPSKDTRFKRQILQFATRGAEQVAGGLSSAAAAIRGAGARLGAAARVRAAARASRPREGAAPGPGLGASLV